MSLFNLPSSSEGPSEHTQSMSCLLSPPHIFGQLLKITTQRSTSQLSLTSAISRNNCSLPLKCFHWHSRAVWCNLGSSQQLGKNIRSFSSCHHLVLSPLPSFWGQNSSHTEGKPSASPWLSLQHVHFYFIFSIFIYLAALGHSCCMQALVLWPGIEPCIDSRVS